MSNSACCMARVLKTTSEWQILKGFNVQAPVSRRSFIPDLQDVSRDCISDSSRALKSTVLGIHIDHLHEAVFQRRLEVAENVVLVTCPAHRSLLDFTILTTLGDPYNSLSSSL
ncbi:hypothetical protein L798_13458 [Zootermopsis nevadensis]|uniref:Uncharacterized protein n=1 Tax=Zootermopsis nevadensis TaxID=136037 RepID=A0A067QRV1_ZOONE|nr:hypothetical protein L798_13458 [Zootermopsis nevadensis]